MRSDEEIGKRRAGRKRTRLLLSRSSVLAVRVGAYSRRRGRNIANPDPPPEDAVFDRFRFFFADHNFRKDDGVYDSPFRRRRIGDNSRRPNTMPRRSVRRIDEDVRVQQHHGSRVDSRNSSQESVMRSGYSDMALRQPSRRLRIARLSRRRSKISAFSMVIERTLSLIAPADSIPVRFVANGAARPVFHGTSRRPGAVPVIGLP